jgi:polyhydroxyalkanoate synthesis repressor PhaR
MAIFAGKEGESGKGAKKAQTPWGQPCGGQIRVNQGLSAWRLSLEWPIAADFLMALALQEFSLPTKPSAQSISPDPSAPTSATEGIRTIKKYPNRRLYDTTSSTYVTLAEIKKLIMRATPMVVLDAKTGEDLTRAILLQIILEEETAGVPMFTEAVLSNIIRFYGHSMQGYMGSYLENHVQSFMDWQSKLGESSPALSPEVWSQFMQWQSPLMQSMFSGLADPAQGVMVQMQDQVQKHIQKNTEQMLGVLGFKAG